MESRTMFLDWKSQYYQNEGIPDIAQWLMNPTRNYEVEGLLPGLAQWVNDPALP